MRTLLPATSIFLVVLANALTYSNAYLSEATMKKTQQMLKSVCSKKYPVNNEILENVKKGIFVEDDEMLKGYFTCTLKTMQLVNANGLIDKKSFKNKMVMLAPPSVLEIILPCIEECVAKDYDPPSDAAYYFIKCSYGVNPKVLDFLPV